MKPGVSTDQPVDFDLIIIGGGPAGTSAALSASAGGAQVCLLDEQATPGGQIYRQVLEAGSERVAALGPDYLAGRTTVNALVAASVHRIQNASVWRVDEDGGVCFSVNGRGRRLRAHRVLVATGALERPVPYPGWTLPGVMSAGAAQILMKSAGVFPREAVLVGSGPLLYLLCEQLINAGCPPLALVETQTGSWRKVVRHLPGAIAGRRYLLRGLRMLKTIRRAGVTRYRGASHIRLQGERELTAVCFNHRGTDVTIPCQQAFLHQGVVPNTQITRSLGLEHQWDAGQACFRPVTDGYGRTSLPAILVTGDGGGIIGAQASLIAGEIAAVSALLAIGKLRQPSAQSRLAELHKRLQRELSVRPLLDALYFPPDDVLRPADDAIVCRCENVTASEIRDYARLGCIGPNQTKAFGRAGMGQCQGRFCGLTVTNLLAQAHGASEQATGYYRIRPPIKPVTVGELADLVRPD